MISFFKLYKSNNINIVLDELKNDKRIRKLNLDRNIYIYICCLFNIIKDNKFNLLGC